MQLWLVSLSQEVKLEESNPALADHLPDPPLVVYFRQKVIFGQFSLHMVALTFAASSEFSRESSGFLFAFIGFRPPEVFGRVVADADAGGDRSSSFNGSEPITTGTTW